MNSSRLVLFSCALCFSSIAANSDWAGSVKLPASEKPIRLFNGTDKPEMLKPAPIGLQLHSNNKPQEYHFRGLLLSKNPEDRLATLTTK